jgi:iron complex transport system ATP-binding protein
MRVPSASLYAVLGPNGSGKSTLLRALLGSLPLAGGSVSVDGVPVGSWSRRALARSVGVVTQSESLTFPISVRDLVAMGRYPHLGPLEGERTEDRDAVQEALSQCDALHLAHRDAGSLSGGEFQRVRIARALAQQPRGLVLDEPTASLDIRHEMGILGLLRASADAGLAVILVTHHIELAARFANRLLLLSEGAVAAEGSAREVLTERTLTEVYGWQIVVRDDPVTGCLSIIPTSAPSEPHAQREGSSPGTSE